jgi:hypothetical protein
MASNSKTKSQKQSTLTPARSAIRHNESILKAKYPNIVHLMPAFDQEDHQRIPCVHVCVHDRDHANIPRFLEFPHRNGSTRRVKVQVIPDFGPIQPQAARGDMLFNTITPGLIGTVGCIVQNTSSQFFAITCNHVMTGKKFQNAASPGQKADERRGATVIPLGPWVAGKMNTTIDAAVIGVANSASVMPNGLASTVTYTVKDADCGVTRVTLKGAVSLAQTAFVIHKGQSMPVAYSNQQVTLNGLITLSASNIATNFSPVTRDGDSGALVSHADNKQPVGIVLGANGQFTFVMPIDSVISAFEKLGLSIIL